MAPVQRSDPATVEAPGAEVVTRPGTAPAPARGAVRLRLFCSGLLTCAGEPVELGRGELRLLALLAVRGRQRRSYAAGTLWPEVSERAAMKRLRNTISDVRHRCPAALQIGDGTIALAPGVEVDVTELVETAQALVDGVAPTDVVGDGLRSLLSPAELLPGWYDDWLQSERSRVDELRIRALGSLVDRLLGLGRLAEASAAAVAAIELDPLRESSHRALMRVYLAEGNPAPAVRQLERYRRLLADEMPGLEPTQLMTSLVVPGTAAPNHEVQPGR